MGAQAHVGGRERRCARGSSEHRPRRAVCPCPNPCVPHCPSLAPLPCAPAGTCAQHTPHRPQCTPPRSADKGAPLAWGPNPKEDGSRLSQKTQGQGAYPWHTCSSAPAEAHGQCGVRSFGSRPIAQGWPRGPGPTVTRWSAAMQRRRLWGWGQTWDVGQSAHIEAARVRGGGGGGRSPAFAKKRQEKM